VRRVLMDLGFGRAAERVLNLVDRARDDDPEEEGDEAGEREVVERKAGAARDSTPGQCFDSRPHRRGKDEPEEDERDHELQLPEGQGRRDERDHDECRQRCPLRSFLHDRDFSPLGETGKRMVTSGWEKICLDERRHAVVLALPFARALGVAAVGIGLMAIGWPASIAGVALQALGAFIALRAVWSWEQTRVVLTTDKLFVVHGTLRKRAAAVRLARIGTVEIEQGLIGRLLGYGTIVAGDLEIEYVPEPRRVYGLVERLSA